MSYTTRLKLCIAMDLLIFIIAIILTNPWNNNDSALSLVFLLFLLFGFIATQFYKDSGKCKMWRSLWRESPWMLVLYAVIVISLFLTYGYPENPYYKMVWIVGLISNPLIRDVRYFRYAVKFNIDSFDDVYALISKFPEAKQLISKEI